MNIEDENRPYIYTILEEKIKTQSKSIDVDFDRLRDRDYLLWLRDKYNSDSIRFILKHIAIKNNINFSRQNQHRT